MKHLMLFILIIWSSLLLAQDGGIATKYMNDPAADLTQNGKLLLPDEVHELYTNSNGKFDISKLNPIETSDLWKNTFVKTLPSEIPAIEDQAVVEYHSPILSPSGIFRFNIVNKSGDNRFYTMMLSKSVHSSLLAKSLLRKIGYQVPDIKRIPQVTVKFKTENDKLLFINYLEKVAMAGTAKSWIVEDLGDKLILQDVVVLKSNNIIYNLAYGVTPEMIQGRRLISATVVPLSIVNLPESVNMLRYSAALISNNKVALDLPKQDEFQCTWDDARWISRRIEKLTRKDWEEIVASAEVPKIVQQVLIERLISRRNSIMKVFKIDAEQLPIDPKLNIGLELVDGKLTQKIWPGYASQFAFGDPASPLSDSDMKAWVKSRAISTGMEVALGQINQLPFMGTDIQKMSSDIIKKEIERGAAESILTKVPYEMPVKTFVFPTVRGNLIFSRNLVTGTYLGTDNLVQLVDTVGVSISAGVYAGTMGIKTQKINNPTDFMPINVSGGAQASYLRTYAHLRPAFYIKQSLKYPFVNILVPLVKVDIGRTLHAAYATTINTNATEEQRRDAVAAALAPFKDLMKVGESILVTDSLVKNIGGQTGANLFGKLFSVSMGLNANHIVMSRFHVHRRSDDVFHVYKDVGHKGSTGINLSMDSLIPVLTVSFKKSAGHAKVKYFKLDLSKENPEALNNAQALRSAIVHSSTGEMEEKGIKPYVLAHSFKEASPSVNLLFWQLIRQNSSTDITVTNPAGEKKNFRRHYFGQTKGRNYQAYVNSVINHWIGLLFQTGGGLSEATGTNPGYSFKGQAQTKFLTLDQELDEKGDVIEPFVSISRVWNGWSITRTKAEELLENIRQLYKVQFFNAPVLNDTTRIFMYSVNVNIFLYQRGLEHLLSLDDKKIKRIFLEHQMQESLVVNPIVEPELASEDYDSAKYNDTGVNRFLRLLKKYRLLDLKNKDDRANKNLLKALSFMEKSVYLPGIVKLVGGEENIYVTSKIDGFREGDETGRNPIRSNSVGEIGSPRALGPVVHMQKTTDMLEGEFFINWMMQRLI